MIRQHIGGVPYDDCTARELGNDIERMLRDARPHTIYYCNAETVMYARNNARFRDVLSRADRIFPDGIGMRIFGAWGSGVRIRERIAGLDVLRSACERAERAGSSVFLLGAEKGVAERVSGILRGQFSHVDICGTSDGYDGMKTLRANEALARANLVIVALGTPLQEQWIDENAKTLPLLRVALAVGGAFDMMTERTPRAPRIMRVIGLEWVWRFVLEPRKRMFRIARAVIVFPLCMLTLRMKIFFKRFTVISAVVAIAGASLFGVSLPVRAQTAGSDLPIIMPRSSWENYQGFSAALNWVPEDKGADTFKDDNPNTNDAIPDYAPVERIVIHDTGCPETSAKCNGNGFDSREVIQSIYRNHAQVRGWGDIGYHYVIDRNGVIYEGRYGGNGVRGAHVYNSKTCQNFNTGTIGIALLGNYAHSQVPDAAFASLAKLIGWLGAANNIDVAETSKTTPVWSNQLIGNKCDVSYGGFSTSFTGPVVVGHDDLEKGNPDPGTLNKPRLRAEAKTWENRYAAYIYKAKDDTAVYAIVGGVLQKMADAVAALSGNDQARTAEINPNQLALFPEQNKTTLPDGTLVKSRSRNDIYLIDGSKRHHITSAILFQKKGYDLAQVQIVSDRELLGYASGDPIVFPDGTLLMSESTKKIYVIKNGERRYILSQRVFTQNGFKIKNVITLPDYELESYVSGGVVGLPEGTLVSTSKKASVPNYVIMDGGKRLIPSQDMFRRWGFSLKNIKIISKADFAQYPDKGDVPYPDGTLIRQDGQPEMYLVYKGKKYWIESHETFKKLKLNAAKVVSLSVEAMIAHPTGGVLTSAADWAAVKSGKTLATKAPVVVPPAPQQTQAPIVLASVPTAAAGTATTTQATLIRIGVFSTDAADAVSVTANAPFTATSAKTGAKTYQAGETATLTWQDAGDTTFIAQTSGAIFTVPTYALYNWDKSINFNSFRGSLALKYSQKSNKVWMVNELPFEDYIADLGEALNSDLPEYQKAFSVAARSYAYFHLKNGGKYGKDEVFHLNNTPSDQVYRGYAWEKYSPKLVEAAHATANEMMTYNGKVARAVYSSDSGGVTKNACDYFKGEFCSPDYAYLSGGVKDPDGTVRRDAASLAASHGVGMSATGARRLAELGKTYKEILAYYYLGVAIEKIY